MDTAQIETRVWRTYGRACADDGAYDYCRCPLLWRLQTGTAERCGKEITQGDDGAFVHHADYSGCPLDSACPQHGAGTIVSIFSLISAK